MRHSKPVEYLFLVLLIAAAVFITGYELELLQTELIINKIVTKDIDYDAFRKLSLNDGILEKAKTQAADIIKNNHAMQELPYVNEISCMTFAMMANSYNLKEFSLVNNKTFCKGIVRVAKDPEFKELYGYYKAVFNDLEFFPVPRLSSSAEDISYSDSWYQPRSYGGDRKHEGTDLMTSNNLRGFFPAISITDGIIEKMGWLNQGGYRIGIRSDSGGYFYYAHLNSYAPELKEGDRVIAGQLLGFLGDSGYGEEGTIGKFDVHLHMGIYVNTDQGEMSVNPYSVLKILEKNRIIYSYR